MTAFRRDRRRLVQALQERGVEDLAILHAFDVVPRHLFVPPAFQVRAYEDAALPIGHGQTISRPSVHASHLVLAELEGPERVLEVGTGSGFQTALLCALAGEVFSVERIPELAERAAGTLRSLGLEARIRVGDGGLGWPEEAPFDVILVGAAAPQAPDGLLEQLAPGGRLLAPVGDGDDQTLLRFRRRDEGWAREVVDTARFVPLVSEAGR
jgi:protein-L-isoaspartate(D-aspartate) O-methyltransferase